MGIIETPLVFIENAYNLEMCYTLIHKLKKNIGQLQDQEYTLSSLSKLSWLSNTIFQFHYLEPNAQCASILPSCAS